MSIFSKEDIQYMKSCIYIVSVAVRLPHPQGGLSQGHETFLAPSTDKKTLNYDTESSNHDPSVSTLRSKRLISSKMKW